MDALTGFLIAGVVVSAIINLAQAIGGIIWNGKIREAKDIQILTIRESKDSEIVSLQRQLEEAKLTNPSRAWQYLVDQDSALGKQIDGLKAQVEELEKQAVDNLRTKAERDSGLEEIALLKREIAVMERERDVTAAVVASRGFSVGGVTFGNPRYIPQAPEDFSHLHNYPDEEGESA